MYDIAKWGLEGLYSFSGCWDISDDIDDAMDCAVSDFKHFLSIPYPEELGDIPSKPIIYRLVRLNDINDLDKTNLGNSWFSNPKQTDKPEFFCMLDYLNPVKNDQGEVYVIKGITDAGNIDMRKTLWERSTQWWENEIVIIDDTKVEILDIKLLKR